jgi:hypothetical protein
VTNIEFDGLNGSLTQKNRSGIPGLYEINSETNRKDIFVTIQQAGSPLTGEMCYPLKGVYAVG